MWRADGDNDREIARLEGLSLEAKERVHTVTTQLSEMLRPRIEVALLRLRESQTRRDIYRRALELHGRMAVPTEYMPTVSKCIASIDTSGERKCQ